jgi:2',3'-cyclic-nucleotide 2'-phosphodiesterase (5'-nucleotidase family)
MRIYLPLFLISILIILSSCNKKECDYSCDPDINLKRIYILNTGDIHEMSYYLPKVAHFIKKFREEHDNVLVFDAGDRFTWWPTYNFNYENGTSDTVVTDLKSLNTNGKAILDLLNMVGYDAMVFGNHSWVYTMDTLVMRINEFNLPILSCNIIYPPDIPSKPSEIFSFGDVNIGVVGVTTGDKDHVLSCDSLDVGSPTSDFVVNEINSLQNSTNLVVLLTHELDNTDEITAYTLQGFDVLIGGHSHTAMNTLIMGKLITKAGLGGMYVGITEIIWNTEKDKLSGLGYSIEYMEEYPYEDAEVKAAIDVLLN